jgi:hypothetical protein
MLLVAGQVAKPPEWGVALVILGAGLALVAALWFMAAVFERNEVAERSQAFNRRALGTASVSGLFLLIGTIETLDTHRTLVNVAIFVSLIAVVVAVRIALRAPRVSGSKVKGPKLGVQETPESPDEHEGERENVAPNDVESKIAEDAESHEVTAA